MFEANHGVDASKLKAVAVIKTRLKPDQTSNLHEDNDETKYPVDPM